MSMPSLFYWTKDNGFLKQPAVRQEIGQILKGMNSLLLKMCQHRLQQSRRHDRIPKGSMASLHRNTISLSQVFQAALPAVGIEQPGQDKDI